MKTAYVLWWRYSDGSGSGVERAYTDETRAQQDFELLTLKAESIKKWSLDTVDLFEGRP